jgi:sterol desaturase/sphingolipid hydroxylase (fatty acid hydroxylase superfamily)
MAAIGSQVLACLLWFTYASFFEWFVHRHVMHVKRFPLHDAFRGHTLVHHQIYHGENYISKSPGRPPHVMLRWYAFPSMLLAHVPLFLLFHWVVMRLTGLPTFWGAFTGCTLYFVGYEYTHYLMHVPRGHYVERFRWFRFLREHHRLHHKYMLRNMNVFIPLADVVLGTLVTAEGWRSKQAKRGRFLDRRRRQQQPSRPADAA